MISEIVRYLNAKISKQQKDAMRIRGQKESRYVIKALKVYLHSTI